MRYKKNILKLLAINIYDKHLLKQDKNRKFYSKIDEYLFDNKENDKLVSFVIFSNDLFGQGTLKSLESICT